MIGSGQRCLSVFITWMGNKVKGIEIISRIYRRCWNESPITRVTLDDRYFLLPPQYVLALSIFTAIAPNVS